RFTATPVDISVIKTPNTLVTSPGALITFTVTIGNDSVLPVSLTSLTDSEYGDLNGKGDCATPTTIASGAEYQCQFTVAIQSNIRPLVHFNQLVATASTIVVGSVAGSSRASGTAVAQDNAWVLLLMPPTDIFPVPIGMIWPLAGLGIAGIVLLYRRRGRRST
ncbi:MAG: hypothetical protein VW983_02265, partial [Halieaceae bacterium]